MSERVPCTGVVIVAAGSGTRLGRGMPKAFVPIAGEPMLSHALRGLVELPGRVAVSVVTPSGDAERRAVARDELGRELGPLGERLVAAEVVDGGANRHASVRAGLAALPAECDVVLVHDAARALTPPALFVRVAGAVRATGHGIVPGLPVVDTIKRVDETAKVLDTVEREELRAAQTPQGFPFADLVRAHAHADAHGGDPATDDAGTFTASGGVVEITRGEPDAFKITTAEDLAAAERLVARRVGADDSAVDRRELRVGVGTDIHAFDDVSPCWLAGIHFPNERGLSGHSDGDAASHAIVDALIGAAGIGSIGSVFGTSDPRYRGAHGAEFLRATRELLAAEGFGIENVSVQVVCQRPRFGERAVEAGQVLGEALGAPVSVSATTSDGLGFTGRTSEGVFAIATVLVRVPHAAG